jgi:glutaredoxin-like protein
MTEANITVYGADWCPDCRRTKRFLDEHSIPYKWMDTDADKEAEAFVRHINDGKRIIPTIIFDDDSFLVEPSNTELADKLGLPLPI